MTIGSKALKICISFDPASPPLRTAPKEKSRYIHKDVHIRMIIKTLLITLKTTFTFINWGIVNKMLIQP